MFSYTWYILNLLINQATKQYKDIYRNMFSVHTATWYHSMDQVSAARLPTLCRDKHFARSWTIRLQCCRSLFSTTSGSTNSFSGNANDSTNALHVPFGPPCRIFWWRIWNRDKVNSYQLDVHSCQQKKQYNTKVFMLNSIYLIVFYHRLVIKCHSLTLT